MNSNHKKLLEELPSLGTWHHDVDLGEGYSTVPSSKKNFSYNPEIRWNEIKPYLPEDLSGKSVLDLACNSGWYSMMMKKLGADRVVAVENNETNIKQANFIARWFDIDLEIIKNDAHVYCLTTEERFDYVICMGLFYHLKYPVIVLDRLAEMTKFRLFFHTIKTDKKLVSDFVPKENYPGMGDYDEINSSEFPKLNFIEKNLSGTPRNYWLPNDAVITGLLRSAGLKIVGRSKRIPLYICEPEKVFGKKVYQKLVFPEYGKDGIVFGP